MSALLEVNDSEYYEFSVFKELRIYNQNIVNKVPLPGGKKAESEGVRDPGTGD